MNATITDGLVRRLRGARRMAVLTGAGFSAESGVPTFRDAQSGLWERFRAEELATPEAFTAHPQRVWDWYAWRRDLILLARPHAGHRALAEMAKRIPEFTLITQNVDGLHQRGGCPDVIELHGNLTRVRCSDGCGPAAIPESAETVPPPCPRCGRPLRPDVVWFGEELPAAALQQAWQAARRCDVFLTIGTSAMVYPAAALPKAALEAGRVVVEINPEETPFSRRATWSLRGPAGAVLPALVNGVWTTTG